MGRNSQKKSSIFLTKNITPRRNKINLLANPGRTDVEWDHFVGGISNQANTLALSYNKNLCRNSEGVTQEKFTQKSSKYIKLLFHYFSELINGTNKR
jgi:hypothetical protein